MRRRRSRDRRGADRPRRRAMPSARDLDRRDAAEVEVAPSPADEVVAQRLQPVELRRVAAALAVDVRLVEVDARRVDRLRRRRSPWSTTLTTTCMIAPRRRAEPGAADDEPRPPAAQDDRRRHHARQPRARARRRPSVEVVLAEHVVQVDPRAGDDHARARAGRRRQRGGVAGARRRPRCASCRTTGSARRPRRATRRARATFAFASSSRASPPR